MEKNSINRRGFLASSAKGAAIVSIGFAGISELLSSCNTTKKVPASTINKTGFIQQPLPYSYDALENIIDAKTMEIHYTKHGAAYAKNLDDAVKEEGVDT